MPVTSEPLGTACPRCGSTKTKVISIGDSPSKRVTETVSTPNVTITMTTGITLGGCDDCRKTWFLPEA